MQNASFGSLKKPDCVPLSPFGCYYYHMSQLSFFPGRILIAAVQVMHQNKIIQSGNFAILLKATVLFLKLSN